MPAFGASLTVIKYAPRVINYAPDSFIILATGRVLSVTTQKGFEIWEKKFYGIAPSSCNVPLTNLMF